MKPQSQNMRSPNTTTNTNTNTNTQRQTQKPQWFGSTVSIATNASPSIPYQPFPEELREQIQPHIRKATERRAEALLAIQRATDANLNSSDGDEPDESATTTTTSSCTTSKYQTALNNYLDSRLSKEGHFGFDTTKFPLREAFQQACGLPSESLLLDDLSKLHHLEERDPPCLSKLTLFRNLTTNPFAKFQEVYDDFVRSVCCPKLAELYDDCRGEIYYQCFPCIRVVEPGEFSIGPHADVAYGHHPFTTNFYVLLTDVNERQSSAALFLEGKPGKEDWHPILGNYGEMVKHFAGAICLHFTTENNTQSTRVSLDFRLIPGPLFHAVADGGNEEGGQMDVYRQKEGYYCHCRLSDSDEAVGDELFEEADTSSSILDIGSNTNENGHDSNESPKTSQQRWERTGPLFKPDARVGFPWTVSDWDKFLAKKDREKHKKKVHKAV